MGTIAKNGIFYGGGTTSAKLVSYDNKKSGSSATNVQGAIDTINTSLNGLKTRPKEDGTREYYNEVTGEWVNFSDGGAELLWTNASPTSNFDAQTISLDLTKYDYVIVEMKYYISTVESATSPYIKFIVPKNSNLYPLRVASEQNGVNYVSFRTITTNDSGITFNIGSAIAGNGWYTTNNGYGIPLTIYGCKAMNVPKKDPYTGTTGNISSGATFTIDTGIKNLSYFMAESKGITDGVDSGGNLTWWNSDRPNMYVASANYTGYSGLQELNLGSRLNAYSYVINSITNGVVSLTAPTSMITSLKSLTWYAF